jgi:hypothetical protein
MEKRRRARRPGYKMDKHVRERGIRSELAAFRNMLHRCYSPINKQYKDYGGREIPITVCDEWRNDFEAFLRDMGRRPPSPDGSRRLEYSLDRIDNDGNYEPDNCRWATRQQQQSNMRSRTTVRYLTLNGRTQTFADWARETGIDSCTLRVRYNLEWSEEHMLLPPPVDRKLINQLRGYPQRRFRPEHPREVQVTLRDPQDIPRTK